MLNELALFAGAGGGILGGSLCGFHTIAACEIEEYPRRVLLARQHDGMLPAFPVWDDVRTFDGRPWRGVVDVITGGFPCQDISSAGRGGGLAGSRSGLWFEMLRIIGEVRPSFVFAENSPHLRTRGLGVVIQGLTGLGYDVRWCVLGAWQAGAPHRRNRMWIYAADANGEHVRIEQGRQRRQGGKRSPQFRHVDRAGSANVADAAGERLPRSGQYVERCNAAKDCEGQTDQLERFSVDEVWIPEPAVGRVAYGVADRMDRLRALGNGQVPAVAAMAWQVLHGADQ